MIQSSCATRSSTVAHGITPAVRSRSVASRGSESPSSRVLSLPPRKTCGRESPRRPARGAPRRRRTCRTRVSLEPTMRRQPWTASAIPRARIRPISSATRSAERRVNSVWLKGTIPFGNASSRAPGWNSRSTRRAPRRRIPSSNCSAIALEQRVADHRDVVGELGRHPVIEVGVDDHLVRPLLRDHRPPSTKLVPLGARPRNRGGSPVTQFGMISPRSITTPGPLAELVQGSADPRSAPDAKRAP